MSAALSRTALVAVLLASIAAYSERPCRAADEAKNNEGWYARPTAPDKDTLQLFDDLGANVVAYRFRLPPDTQLVVVMLAKDENGERIESLSKIYTLASATPGEVFETGFRLVRIDPGNLVENHDGKIRWVMHAGPMTQQTWQPNRYRATGSYASWWQGLKVEAPEIGKDYFLWEIKTHSREIRRLLPDSPTTFSLQLRFRYEPMQPGDPYGATGEGGNEDEEFAREVPDPRIKASHVK